MSIDALYGVALLAGLVITAVAVPQYVAGAWRSRGEEGQLLASNLSARTGAGGPPSNPAQAAAARAQGSGAGFEGATLLGCWGVAFFADLAASALVGDVGRLFSAGGRALFAALIATSALYLLRRRAASRPDASEVATLAVALVIGLFGGAAAAA